MENLFLCVLITAFVVVLLCFSCCGHRSKPQDEDEEVPCPSVSSEQSRRSPPKAPLPSAECYSKELADTCITDDYRFDNHCEIFTQATSDPGELGELWSHLIRMNPKNSVDRKPDELDQWFVKNVEKFIKYGETLAFIEHYPLLEDMFLDNLQDPEHNLELQKRLISICIVGSWRINYVNLLCKYLCRWELLPEISAIVFYDWRFERVRNLHETYRSFYRA